MSTVFKYKVYVPRETHDKSSNMIDKDDVHVETKDVDGNTSFENEQTSYLTSVLKNI